MIAEFKNAMQTSGIVCREAIIADGQIHRFANHGKGRKDGWYVYHDIAGAFGDWSQDIQGKWSAGISKLSPRDQNLLREQQEKAQQTAKAEKIRKHEETSAIALSKWNSLSETSSSPYLEKKKVGAYGVRFGGQNLIIPLRDTGGKLWSFQWIEPDGKKQFLKGGKKKGCFHCIGVLEDGKPIYIVEGYATGASVHMAAQRTVVVAFDAGNLDPVIEQLRKVYPNSPFIIAGDDDAWKDHNTGREKAQQAALKYGCSVVFPSFKDPSSKPTDFNDLLALEGLESVKQQLNLPRTASSPPDWPEPTPLKSIKKDLSPVIPLPSALIPEPFQPWLTDIAERMQCPLDYVAVAALIETAAIIGAGCRVRPKRNDSWSVVPNLWGGIVGRPSTLKSPSLKEVLKPMKALEEEANAIFEKEYKDYLCKVEEYKAHREAIKKKITKVVLSRPAHEVELVKQELRDQKEPEPPIWKRYSTNDTTIEKMHQLLSQNPRGLMVFRDELMGLLSTWDREGHEEDRSFYLEAWNGDDSKTSDRIGRGTTYTKSLCVSILGSTQPDKLFSALMQSEWVTVN
jgi:putative DNA primase/helicase